MSPAVAFPRGTTMQHHGQQCDRRPFGAPDPQGLYDPQHERAACGVGFVVHLKGQRSRAIVEKGLELLRNLEHRGACGCEANTGDGAGILIQIPDAFLRKVTAPLGIALPAPGDYGAGLVFLPRDPAQQAEVVALIESIVAEEGQIVLGWRDVPTDDSSLGESARRAAPVFKHLFIGRGTAPGGRRTGPTVARSLIAGPARPPPTPWPSSAGST